MYSNDNNMNNQDSDCFSDDSQEKSSKKDLLLAKRKDKKDKGYSTLDGESSPEEVETRSPFKSRKSMTFKFSTKKEKREKSREKEKESKECEKEKKKDKEKIKTKSKDKKKNKNSISDASILDISEELPIFGVPLSIAVERNPCHDGVKIPLVIRNCIDFIEEHGLSSDGIYKQSGVKSRVQHVYGLYNKRKTVYESDFDLSIATSLLKQFLRSLPEPILTNTLLAHFEDHENVKTACCLKKLIELLPLCNQDIIKWLFVHFKHICENDKHDKTNVTLLGTIFSPLLQISPHLFNKMMLWTHELFPDTKLTRYIPPLRCVSPNMPTSLDDVTLELQKQESLLNQIHFEMNSGFINKDKEDELWGVQRNITNLKRKLKSIEKEKQKQGQNYSKTTTESTASVSSQTETIDNDGELKMSTNKIVGSVNTLIGNLNDVIADTVSSTDEGSEKHVNYESSQENLNHQSPICDSIDEEEKALEFESTELMNMMQLLQEDIKTERLKINKLKAELHASKINISVNEYLSSIPDDMLIDKVNECDDKTSAAIKEYTMLMIQKESLVRSILEERETIIDLKVHISMKQYKHKLTNIG